MAKVTTEVVSNDPVITEPNDQPKTADKAEKTSEPISSADPETGKLVKVRGLKDERSTIAGKVYNIKAKQVTEVPEGVCAIWQNSGVAIKL